jgi:hypothetical protein
MKKSALVIFAGIFSVAMYLGNGSQNAIASPNDGILTDSTKKEKKAEVKPSATTTTTTTTPVATTPVTKPAVVDTAKAKKK